MTSENKERNVFGFESYIQYNLMDLPGWRKHNISLGETHSCMQSLTLYGQEEISKLC